MTYNDVHDVETKTNQEMVDILKFSGKFDMFR
jgi:hypothetical protein